MTRDNNNLTWYLFKNQSVFIKQRNIKDNFVFVNNMVKELHTSKIPMILLKLDIAKAFDSVNWSFHLDRMRDLGFGQVDKLGHLHYSKLVVQGGPKWQGRDRLST